MPIELTRALADFVVRTPSEEIPPAAFERASKCIVDTVGCILAGAASELAEPMEKYLADGIGAGPAGCVVAGTAFRTTPERAALVNGSFGHALDFDDTLSMMPAHPSTVILPALFASIDERTTGHDVMDAYVIGLEVGAKLGLAIGNGHYRRGFHATGTLAIFSAMTARRRDGAEQTVRVDKPRRSPERELTWDDVRDKFLGCARHAGLDAEAAASLFAAWRSLDAAACAAPLLNLLAKH
jgi:2-methylcitrate dehydratase PrpD